MADRNEEKGHPHRETNYNRRNPPIRDVVRELKNNKRPSLVPALRVHAVLGEGRGAAGISRHQLRSAATSIQFRIARGLRVTERQEPDVPSSATASCVRRQFDYLACASAW
jgi:hypothetical protein